MEWIAPTDNRNDRPVSGMNVSDLADQIAATDLGSDMTREARLELAKRQLEEAKRH